jgi:hypothetical protein
MRGKAEFTSGFNPVEVIDSVLQKFSLTKHPNQNHYRSRSIPPEGRLAIATNAGWNAMDVRVLQGVRHNRGRQRRVVLIPLGWC